MRKFPTICTCAVNDIFIEYAKKIIYSVRKFKEISFVILTDKPNKFNNLYNVETIKYNKSVFSYHDKIFPVFWGIKKYGSIILIDSDTEISDKCLENKIENFHLDNIISGAYVKKFWEKSMENFLEGNDENIPYGRKFVQYCESNGLDTKGVKHIQESFLFIKEKNQRKIDKFLKIWWDLKKISEKNDSVKNRGNLGYGEGFSIAIALHNAGIEIHNEPSVQSVASCFGHIGAGYNAI